jgi:hypothetical protein
MYVCMYACKSANGKIISYINITYFLFQMGVMILYMNILFYSPKMVVQMDCKYRHTFSDVRSTIITERLNGILFMVSFRCHIWHTF